MGCDRPGSASCWVVHGRIDVITGRDEARLIYEGVSAELNPETWRLVIDIGGRPEAGEVFHRELVSRSD